MRQSAEFALITLKFTTMHTFAGRITKDATSHSFDNGITVVNFTIVENYSYKNREGKIIQKPYYIECEHWNGINLLPYLTQGTVVAVWGSLGTRGYIANAGKPDEEIRSVQTCRIEGLRFLSSTNGGKKSSSGDLTPTGAPEGGLGEGGDLPF
jgi:single-stranded DNA-binding protein